MFLLSALVVVVLLAGWISTAKNTSFASRRRVKPVFEGLESRDVPTGTIFGPNTADICALTHTLVLQHNPANKADYYLQQEAALPGVIATQLQDVTQLANVGGADRFIGEGDTGYFKFYILTKDGGTFDFNEVLAANGGTIDGQLASSLSVQSFRATEMDLVVGADGRVDMRVIGQGIINGVYHEAGVALLNVCPPELPPPPPPPPPPVACKDVSWVVNALLPLERQERVLKQKLAKGGTWKDHVRLAALEKRFIGLLAMACVPSHGGWSQGEVIWAVHSSLNQVIQGRWTLAKAKIMIKAKLMMGVQIQPI